MKTIEDIIREYKSETLDGRDLYRLLQFLSDEQAAAMGMEIKPEFIGKRDVVEFTREAVLAQLKEDVAFGFEKALNCRGISSSLMYSVVMMWNWILEEGIDDEVAKELGYTMYGLPLFKATAVKYGFDNPIGDDEGSEMKYSEYGE